MIATTETQASETNTVPTHLQTVDEFEAWERQPPFKGNYEFVRGRIIPKPAMKQDEIFISGFLVRLFYQSAAAQEGNELLLETDSYVDARRKRVPDLTYITADQKQVIRRGERVSTLFAIEILSESETFDDILDKLQDYFDGGAQLVWYIAPKRHKIFAYTSPDESKTYKGQDLISAAPIVPALQFVVADLFA